MAFRKKKILLIDDNVTLIMYTTMLLKRMGFEITPAPNGLEALKIMNIWDPDLILLDMTMPVMDGATTLKNIKKHKDTSNIPVVIISVESERTLLEECGKMECDGFLTKPINLDKLHDLLQQTIYSPMGFKRRYLRSAYHQKVLVKHHEFKEELYAETLSEGGIYLRKKDPLDTGTLLEITLPVASDRSLVLKGPVIYKKDRYGDLHKTPLGMAVEFEDIKEDEARLLKKHVSDLLTQDILDSQEEEVIEV